MSTEKQKTILRTITQQIERSREATRKINVLITEWYQQEQKEATQIDEVEPLIYKDHNCKVYHNGSGEIFVELNKNKVKTRISINAYTITVTATHNSTIRCNVVNGLPAFVIGM